VTLAKIESDGAEMMSGSNLSQSPEMVVCRTGPNPTEGHMWEAELSLSRLE